MRVVGQDDNVSDGNSGFRIILDNSSSTTASEYVGLMSQPADVTEEGGEAVFTVLNIDDESARSSTLTFNFGERFKTTTSQ